MINWGVEVEEDVACPADDMKTMSYSRPSVQRGGKGGRENEDSPCDLISISREGGRPCGRRKAVEIQRGAGD